MQQQIKWDKQFAVGHSLIDDQHKMFVELVARVEAAVADKEEKEHIVRLLDELFKYAVFHFKSEENLMLRIGYPYLAEHERLHKDILHEIGDKLLSLSLNKVAASELVDFLYRWFVEHTSTEDLRIATFLKES
jgi:hemerythrin